MKADILNAEGKKIGNAEFIYVLNRDGSMKVQTTFEPDTSLVKSMARLGITFEMKDTYENVTYLGRGNMKPILTGINREKIGGL